MDTFKYLVLVVTFAALVCVQQNNPEAAPGDLCTDVDDTNCTTTSEECNGTSCTCSQDYYQDGNVCNPKADYGGTCTNTAECKAGLTCVNDDSNNKKCLCAYGTYLVSGTTCVSTDALKPTIGILTSAHDSVSLTWSSAPANGYTNNYVIKYTPQGGNQQTTPALGDVAQITVSGLTPGKSYTFVVSRSITGEGRTQTDIDSAGNQTVTKADYGGSCSTVTCKTGLTCVDDDSSNKKCLCADGTYLGSGSTCVSTDGLKSTIGEITSTHNTVTLKWTSPVATGYTNSYVIKYTPQGGNEQTTAELGSSLQTTVGSLSPGKSYSFVVTRYITREGRKQPVQDSFGTQITTKVDYGGSCITVTCKTGLTCVDDDSGNKKCLCAYGTYLGSGSTCVSTDGLKPTIGTLTSAHDSVSLTWSSPTADGYTNNYVIKYTPQGGTQQTTSALGDVSQKTISGLTPGTSYTFVVSRSINREGRTQSGIDSAGIQIVTKLDYAAICTSSPPCRSGLSCEMIDDQSVRKCLCANGYYTGGSCVDKSGLKPVITDVTVATDTARITWTSPTANGYINSYIIKYSSTEGGRTHTVAGDVSVTTVSGLTPGVQYTFVVSRSITREGRTQANIDSIGRTDSTDKIDYGQSCTQNGTCKDLYSNCYSDECRCDPGYFRNTAVNICQSNVNLKPSNTQTQRLSTTQIRVNWTSPGYTGAGFNGYELDVTPIVNPGNISISGTTATLSSLTPGEKYNITVKTKISYFGRDERAAADQESEITIPATTTGTEGAGNTTLNAPDIQIWFHKADGVAQGYDVRLQRVGSDAYDQTVSPANTGASIQAVFINVTAGRTYTVSIITNSYGLTSEPFTKTIRVMAQQAGSVDQLQAAASNITSRSVYVTWKRPKRPNGNIYHYSLQAFNNGKCVQQIILNCTACNRTEMRTNETFDTMCDNTVNLEISEDDIGNDDYLVTHNMTGLFPDITYNIQVSAYNEEGKGVPASESSRTSTEAAGEPTSFRSPDQTSSSIFLTWTPPVPRPGVTGYTIVVYEREEDSQTYQSFNTTDITGYENNTFNVTGLSSYWNYSFTIVAFTVPGSSQLVQLSPVRTKESEPEKVVNLKHSQIDNVYDQLQLTWECPKEKDRNGAIKSATVKLTTNTTSADFTPKQGYRVFPMTGTCTWTETVKATAEFNYTFEVYVSNNGFNGTKTPIYRYMPPGPAKISQSSVTKPKTEESNLETIIPLQLCPSCLLGRHNGRIISSGVTVCKHPCAQKRRRRALTMDEYDKMQNWHTAKAKEFNGEYRATSDNWLAGDTNGNTFEYQIGKDSSCEQKGGNEFCNGPLPSGTKFVIVVFACTSVACDRSENITISTKVTPINVALIAGAIGGVVAAIIIIIIVVLVVRHMRRPQTTKLDPEEIEEELILKKRPIRICNLEKRVEEMHKDSNLLFSEEFEDINALSPKNACVASETGSNKLKNRYVNILPFDHSRVKLRETEEDEDETDYINGNYIPGYRSQREYIATQGPMTGTVNDFWRMIWEQNVPIIVMLSDLTEKGKPKVDRYYPENMDPVHYGDIIVEMTNYSPLNKYVIRIFKLQLGDEVRMVRHYFLPGWQDFGANLTSDDVINFLKSVRMEIKPNNQGPLCIHCSAGVGRTGTYITLDVFQQHIDEEDMNKEIDIFDFTLKMRNNRSYMIQTEKQYIFVHDTIKEMIIRKKKEISERDNIYQNSNVDDSNVYENQAFEADPQDIYMNVDSTGKPTTAL